MTHYYPTRGVSELGTAIGQKLSGLVAGAENSKAALAVSTYAQMEIASYRILIAAANATGSSGVAVKSERMLAEKEEFAEWVDQQIPILTAEFLRRDETADATAAP